MKQYKDYKVLWAGDSGTLEREVRDYLADGWDLVGGVGISFLGNTFQAIAK